MSDFGALLKQFQQDGGKRLASDGTENVRTSPRKRARQVEARDFPSVEQVFILCPAGVQTGGPEALHQLCDQLNTSGRLTAKIVYCRSDRGHIQFAERSRTLQAYLRYTAPSVDHDPLEEGNPSHLLVWPECWTDEMIDYLSEASDPSPCMIWWLSVNNNTGRFRDWARKDIQHLYQSEYAKQHLLKNGVTYVYPMTEYISDPPSPGTGERTLDVVFNPAKGIHFTDEIKRRSGGAIQFRPIGGGVDGRIRISPEEVRKLLQQAKVYIDFGPHPGMDRLPREAALAGCVVVTNMEGAANYKEDVPLPAKYKIKTFDVEKIHKLLVDILANFEERTKDLEEYRKWIHGQKDRMKSCVDKLIQELVDKRKKS